MLVHFKYKGEPAYAFAIYNFSQVSDAVLFVMADEKQQESPMLFVYYNGNWQTNEDLSFLSAESFQQINNTLTCLFEPGIYPGTNEARNIREKRLAW
jgi:hypothetical protein